MTDILFYIFAFLLIFFSLLVAIIPNLLHSALSLIASFFVTAALYLLFKMEFVALSQIMIYIGGIVIFCIIIILLTTGLGDENLFKAKKSTKIIGCLLSLSLFAILAEFAGRPMELGPLGSQSRMSSGSMDQIGMRLLDTGKGGFIVQFELISILLLVAVIGAIILARKEKN